ncbi:hypothetical protein [Tenacibaculum halocynthiae]|uniref:hypothetical protein n=1 Tax=Tenacibaculum halocynthiae TaxID=1254437 RepID=UPI003D659C61
MINEIVAYTIFHLIFNTIGGTLRWIYGYIWRIIFDKPTYAKQYTCCNPFSSNSSLYVYLNSINQYTILKIHTSLT